MIFEGIELNPLKIPKHIAIIMDGNKRWAEKNSSSVLLGHSKGLERVIEVLEGCEEIGISVLTLFAFSRENWKRPSSEVKDLLQLFKYFFEREFETLKKRDVRILHSGIIDDFDQDIQQIIKTMTSETKDNKRSTLNLAINYSGRLEIIEGFKKLIKDVNENNKEIKELTEGDFNQYLFQPSLPEPDLLIRTSGEIRISNFLLWQIVYTELYFTERLWPDFTIKDLAIAISEYQKRERRFGGRQ